MLMDKCQQSEARPPDWCAKVYRSIPEIPNRSFTIAESGIR